MADRISDRRSKANGFYASIHAALIAVFASLAFRNDDAPRPVAVFLFGALGVLLAVTWYLHLRAYRDLNRAKFAVITDMEKKLPSAPFTQEWDTLKADHVRGWRGRYTELGTIERLVPALLGGIYLAACLWVAFE